MGQPFMMVISEDQDQLTISIFVINYYYHTAIIFYHFFFQRVFQGRLPGENFPPSDHYGVQLTLEEL